MSGKDRWQQLQELFEACIDLPLADRDAVLAAVSDESLAEEARGLIEAAQEPENRFSEVIGQAAQDAVEGQAPLSEGDRLGSYRISGPLGSGGMGFVFQAEDDQGSRVAIKVLSRERAASRDGAQRFATERSILELLDHPNLASLYDAGTTEDGLPWVAMELVEGVPVTEYCRRDGLSLSERLALFDQVCCAVTHAHERDVIHRDLKPANILVGVDRVPKLLDFGIAKFLAPERLEHSVARTATDVRLLTPGYASPEQILGEPVTLRCDIYALGLLLYELATDSLPYDEARSAAELFARFLSDEEPPCASERMAVGGHALDRILGSALARRPEDRFSSVEELRSAVSRLPLSSE